MLVPICVIKKCPRDSEITGRAGGSLSTWRLPTVVGDSGLVPSPLFVLMPPSSVLVLVSLPAARAHPINGTGGAFGLPPGLYIVELINVLQSHAFNLPAYILMKSGIALLRFCRYTWKHENPASPKALFHPYCSSNFTWLWSNRVRGRISGGRRLRDVPWNTRTTMTCTAFIFPQLVHTAYWHWPSRQAGKENEKQTTHKSRGLMSTQNRRVLYSARQWLICNLKVTI